MSSGKNTPSSPQPAAGGGSATRTLAEIFVGFLLTAAVLSFIQFGGPAILDNDGYYHIRWSRLLRESAPQLPEFRWLPLTVLNERDYADHHFLYHLFLAPFTFGDLRTGAKLAAVVFSAAGLTSMFALLVTNRVRYRWFWLAPLIAGSEPFLYRMSMTRAPSLSLALMGVGACLIFRRKLAWLSLLAFSFVWAYSLFPLVLLLALAHAIAVYLAERRVEVGAIVASSAGIVTGLIVNPYFPKNLALFVRHVAMKLRSEYAVAVGVEWYPYETWFFLGGSLVSLTLFFLALLAFDSRRLRGNEKRLFYLILSTFFLVAAFKSRRFVEYWPPFAVVFAALTITPRLIEAGRSRIRRTGEQVAASVLAATGAVFLITALVLAVIQARQEVQSEPDPFAYRGASEWLASNTPQGSVVFNTDWDDFPMLFYYNTQNAYVVGLDPTYLYDRDPELWKLYARVTLGEESDPAPIIKGRFGAEYVFTDNRHEAFLTAAYESGDFKTVYSDRYATVLRVTMGDEGAGAE